MPQGTFDIGVDRGSAELVLAWERWHHQFVQTLYYRWTRRMGPIGGVGSGTAVITVTREHQITAELIDREGSPYVSRAFIDAINSLTGNPGLTFPNKSQRQSVTFTHKGWRSHTGPSGYDWHRNDFEKVRTEY